MTRKRCGWAPLRNPLYVAYHDEEWGVPVHDERRLLEMLCLEGAQAGLSWETILGKRARYREVFAGFDPAKVARFGERDVARLLADPGIVRHEGKIRAAIANAQAVLALPADLGGLDRYLWSFVGGKPRVNRPRALSEIPARTPESDAMSKDLKRRGFKFVGSTTCYAFMQACGLVDDHMRGCFRTR